MSNREISKKDFANIVVKFLTWKAENGINDDLMKLLLDEGWLMADGVRDEELEDIIYKYELV